ncbi:hypothetical protein KP509_21G038800 [Ceratopteris richardii]|uniref:Uncharacterized protein n=1 Tax=Ceratopteris richardii TaxID=49495 RepID=A0A8T2SBZ7_CERRI|nr:hypothetical protein KP509_21G038800 [Ceratopteris richardii]
MVCVKFIRSLRRLQSFCQCIFSRIYHRHGRKRAMKAIYEDVQRCGDGDIQVMWRMLMMHKDAHGHGYPSLPLADPKFQRASVAWPSLSLSSSFSPSLVQ